MYSNQKNIQILISLLKQYNIRDVVISPGSRNMAFVRSVETDAFFKTYSVIDERSAAYFAIGVWLETGRPVALSSTSAQATRNYIPGMTEAFYRGAQLVFITADYRPSMIGQGVMQALDQLSIPKDSAKYSIGLPMVKDANDYRYCVRLVNEALLELDHHGAGPVHIDVPVEEHWTGGVAVLPQAGKINRHITSDRFPEINNLKIIIVIGQHQPFNAELQKAIDEFANKFNVVIYTNHLSNYQGQYNIDGSLLLEGLDFRILKNLAPDVVITIGGQPGDYALNGALLNMDSYQHWRVHEDGVIRDTYGRLTEVFEMSELEFFKNYNKKVKQGKSDNSYFKAWARFSDKRIIPDQLPLSHAHVASELIKAIPSQSVIHFGILSSLRNWNYFKNETGFIGYSNVAAFGIDGCMSTFIGQSIASSKPSFLIIGDLSFFYDMNALGIRQVKNNARIVLVNNNGGGEFRLFSNAASEFGEDANKHIAAAGHHGSARAWVESMGWEYLCVHTKDELASCISKITDASERPILVEVFTTMKDDSDGVKKMIEANTNMSLKGRVASTISPKTRRNIKKILKKSK